MVRRRTLVGWPHERGAQVFECRDQNDVMAYFFGAEDATCGHKWWAGGGYCEHAIFRALCPVACGVPSSAARWGLQAGG